VTGSVFDKVACESNSFYEVRSAIGVHRSNDSSVLDSIVRVSWDWNTGFLV
jgi:hypothetical protein